LEASFDPTYFRDNYVSKPILSREGVNITIHQNETVTEHEGTYGGADAIFQGLAQIPCLGGNYPVFGSWVICGDRQVSAFAKTPLGYPQI
jgi:glutathionylspermidine synthase